MQPILGGYCTGLSSVLSLAIVEFFDASEGAKKKIHEMAETCHYPSVQVSQCPIVGQFGCDIVLSAPISQDLQSNPCRSFVLCSYRDKGFLIRADNETAPLLLRLLPAECATPLATAVAMILSYAILCEQHG